MSKNNNNTEVNNVQATNYCQNTSFLASLLACFGAAMTYCSANEYESYEDIAAPMTMAMVGTVVLGTILDSFYNGSEQ